jgi:hypothetical protein
MRSGSFPHEMYEMSLICITTPTGLATPGSFDSAVATLRSWASSDVSIKITTEQGELSASGSGSQMIGFLLGRPVVESVWAPKV